MRELKFRAWDVEKSEMRFMDNPYWSQFIAAKISMGDKCLWDCRLMQFTGLHDQNGKEIYEGDVLTGEDGSTVTIKFLDGCFCMDDCVDSWMAGGHCKYWEIIGNVFENPDLAQEGKDA